MNTKITRRDWAAGFGAIASASKLRGQESPVPQPEDLNAAAKEQLRKNSDALAKVDLPMSTEPAFLFRA